MSGTVRRANATASPTPSRVDPARRDDAAPAVGHERAEPRVVAQRRAEAAADRRRPGRVDRQPGVLLGAQRRPQLAGDQLRQRRAAGALGDEPEQVGVGRGVVEALAVPPVGGADRRQELEDRSAGAPGIGGCHPQATS